MITQEQLKSILRYEPETGKFYWLINSGRAFIGNKAGNINSEGYVRIRIDGQEYKAHRLAWLYVYGVNPENEIDHINGIKDDNRIVNLRDVSHQENCKNQKNRINNTSGIQGVSWNKDKKKWTAGIRMNEKWNYLGGFEDKFEAICARKSAERRFSFHQNHGRSV